MYYDALKSRVEAAKAAQKSKKAARMILENMDVTAHIAPVYKPLHDDIAEGRHTTYNLPGGRGSCKSSFVSLEVVNGIMQDPTGRSNAIVFRLVAGTMRDSVYSQIGWAIDALGVNHLWRGRVSPMSYTYLPTGAQIVFRGLDDPLKLKSIKPTRGTFRYVWLEEFAELPGPNFTRNVMQSVMRGQGNGFVVFRSFNPPISAANWANQLIQEPDEKAITLLTNYTQVPPEWLGESFLYEAERLKAVNPMAYRHEYMGEPTGTGGEVFPNLEIRAINQEETNRLGYVYQGLDFGFAQDPLCFLRAAFDRRSATIYVLDEIYRRQMSNAQIVDELKKRHYDKECTTCDDADPKSIMDLRDSGIYALACYKRPGCVEYRVKWMQHRKIVIDPKRTPNTYREFTTYSYDTDKDGNFISRLPDKDNHSIDALAYALEPLIYERGTLA